MSVLLVLGCVRDGMFTTKIPNCLFGKHVTTRRGNYALTIVHVSFPIANSGSFGGSVQRLEE